MVLMSSVAIAIATCSGDSSERTASPALGPTPLTLMSDLKVSSSVLVAKPNSSIASSRTFRQVYSITSLPGLSVRSVLKVVWQ